MRILFAHIEFPSQYENLARYLAAQPGNEVAAIASAAGTSEVKWPQGVQRCVYPPPAPQPAALAGDERALMTGIRIGQAAARQAIALRERGFYPDVILAHSGTGEALFLRDIFPRSRIIAYCEIVHRLQNSVGFDAEIEYPTGTDFMMRLSAGHVLLALDAADRGVAATRWQRAQFPAAYQPWIEVIHDGIDTEVVAPDPAALFKVPRAGMTLSPADEVVTYVSRSLEPQRGFHTFMRALPEIQRRRPAARVVVVGSDDVSYSPRPGGGETYRSRLLRELGGKIDLSRVHFAGRIPRRDYLSLLRVSSVHIYLTYPFVLSWSCIEAMAAGCLLVGSRTAPVEEVIADCRNGLLVDFFSPEELSARVVDALGDRAGMQPLRDAARRTAIEHYDFKRVCLPRHLKLIDDVIAGSQPR